MWSVAVGATRKLRTCSAHVATMEMVRLWFFFSVRSFEKFRFQENTDELFNGKAAFCLQSECERKVNERLALTAMIHSWTLIRAARERVLISAGNKNVDIGKSECRKICWSHGFHRLSIEWISNSVLAMKCWMNAMSNIRNNFSYSKSDACERTTKGTKDATLHFQHRPRIWQSRSASIKSSAPLTCKLIEHFHQLIMRLPIIAGIFYSLIIHCPQMHRIYTRIAINFTRNGTVYLFTERIISISMRKRCRPVAQSELSSNHVSNFWCC